MSLVGFQAQNHPQQLGLRGANPAVDDRATTREVFDPLDERFRFTLDVAASSRNAKCDRFFSIDDNGLIQSWSGERVWCNPPFSNCAAWVEKAWWEFRGGASLVVMLLPANRTEQRWWQEMVEPYPGSVRLAPAGRVPPRPPPLYRARRGRGRAQRTPTVRLLPADLGGRRVTGRDRARTPMKREPVDDITARVRALGRSGDLLRDAVVQELEDWREGFVIAPVNLLQAVEAHDEANRERT